MIERIAADAVVLVHLAFILFVLLGGLAVLMRTWMAMLHLPAVGWGACVELLHLRCPLTDLENSLRHAAGESGYPGGFVERYILPVIYPAGLTDAIQLWLGAVVISLNLLVYGLVLWRGLKRRTAFLGVLGDAARGALRKPVKQRFAPVIQRPDFALRRQGPRYTAGI